MTKLRTKGTPKIRRPGHVEEREDVRSNWGPHKPLSLWHALGDQYQELAQNSLAQIKINGINLCI